MTHSPRWKITLTLALTGAMLVVFFLWLQVQTAASAGEDPRRALQAAWERLQQAASYQFNAEVLQTNDPVAKLENVGRTSRQQRIYLQGTSNPPEQVMQFRLWNDGGSLLDPSSGSEMRVEGSKAYGRKAGEAWQELDNFTGAFAPQGDFLAFLAEAQNVQEHFPGDPALGPSDPLQAPPASAKIYTFEVNGPAFARYMRDRTQQQLEAAGKLPQGAMLEVSRQLVDLKGQGELWVDEAGLPLRQELHLVFPPGDDEQVLGQVTVTFADIAAPPPGLASLLERRLEAALPYSGLSGAFLLAAALGIWLAGRRRLAYAALVGLVIFSMLFGPLVQSARAANFLGEQQAQAGRQEAQRAEADEQQRIERTLNTPGIRPNVSPLAAAGQKVAWQQAQSQAAGPALPVLNGELAQPQAPSVYTTTVECNTVLDHPELDSDKDGLADCQEFYLGTDPRGPDTDGDTITDTVEVKGFQVLDPKTGQYVTWYGDPLEKDTNKDGLGDWEEWGLDTDKDGTPDMWSRDNDGDKVADDKDLSPYDAKLTPFNQDNPLQVVINDLTPGVTSTLELQLRPTNPAHLRYAFNVFKWPTNDIQGQMMDMDGKTYKDVYPDSDSPQDANGDVKVFPMLEITAQGKPNNLPDAETLRQYGISMHKLDESGDKLAAYVPLQLVKDKGDNWVAFTGKMPYIAAQSWGNAHQVRMVWMVQALTETCKEKGWKDGRCWEVDKWNQPTLLVVYSEEFVVTGLKVREDQGTEIAIVFKDPTTLSGENVAGQINRLEPFTDLELGLERSFLAGRTVTDTRTGKQVFDIPLAEVQRRFDHTLNAGVPVSPTRFNISQNIFRVSLFAYPSLDMALYQVATTETKQILKAYYTPAWTAAAPITPTLLFARQERFRSLNLELGRSGVKNVAWTGSLLTLDLPLNAPKESGLEPVRLLTMASMNWAPYKYQKEVWSGCPLNEFLDSLDLIYPADQFPSDPDAALGSMVMFKAYYASLYQGAANIIALDNLPQPAPYGKIDIDIAKALELINSLWKTFRKVVQILVSLLIIDFAINHGFGKVKDVFRGNDIESLFRAIGKWCRGQALPAETAEIMNLFFQTMEKVAKITQVVTAVLALVWVVVSIFFLIFHVQVSAAVSLAVSIVFLSLAGILALVAAIKLIVSWINLGLREAWKLLKELGGGIKACLILTAIMIGLTIIMTILAIALDPNVKWGSIQADAMIAQMIAMIIVLIIYALISMIPVIGQILSFILSLIDFLLGKLCNGKDLTYWIFKAIFAVDQIVELETDTYDVHIKSDKPGGGFTAGNSLSWSMVMTTTAKNAAPDSWILKWAIKWGRHPYERNDIRGTAAVWKLDKQYVGVKTSHNAMYDRWSRPVKIGEYDDNTLYATWLTDSLSANGIQLRYSGANVEVKAVMNIAYAIPVEECWAVWGVLIVPIPACADKVAEGNNHKEIALGVFDIFPGTLDEFYKWDWSNRYGSMSLPKPVDHDNDGLRVGFDPNDKLWDMDGDTLSDFYEYQMNQKPYEQGGGAYNWSKADSDDDGLRDDEELRLGSNPASSDTDRDGRSDLEEALGYAFIYGPQGVSTLVRSNPTQADADRDGISDYSEYLLYRLDASKYPYRPDVWNTNPLAFDFQVQSKRSFVAPGWQEPLTATLRNLAKIPLMIEGSAAITMGNHLSFADGGITRTVPFAVVPGGVKTYTATLQVEAGVPSTKTAVTGNACGAFKPPLFYLPLDEPAGSTTFSNTASNNYYAVCPAGHCPTAGVQGVKGKAVQFTTNKQVLNIQEVVGGDFFFPSFTFDSWIWPQADSNGMLLYKYAGIEYYRLRYSNNGGDPQILFSLGGGQKIELTICPARQPDLNWKKDGWNNLALVKANDRALMYVNGVLADPAKCSGASQESAASAAEEITGGREAGKAPDEPFTIAALGQARDYFDGYSGYLDEAYFYDWQLSQDDIQKLIRLSSLAGADSDAARGCDFNPYKEVPLVIDNDTPTSTIVTLQNNAYIYSPGVIVVGGLARDPTSFIAQVEVMVDGSEWWKPASGGEVWSYAWDVSRAGRHTLVTRATDAVGHMESPGPGISVYIDRTAPEIDFTPGPIYAAGHSPQGRWTVSLSGRVADLCAGVKSVEVLLEGQGQAAGNGWQTATVQGQGNHACLSGDGERAPAGDDYLPWSIDYLLPEWDNQNKLLPDPTGVYTVSVRAADLLDNITRPDAYVTGKLRLDATSPVASLDVTNQMSVSITSTLTLRGVITDPGTAASGVQGLEIAFMPAESVHLLENTGLLLHLDEPAGLQVFEDSSGEGNPGVCALDAQGDGAAPVTACPQAGLAGKIDQAVQFDGRSSAITIWELGGLQLTNTLSLAAWFNTSAATIGFQNLVGKWTLDGSDGAYALYWQAGGPGLTFGVQNAEHKKAEAASQKLYNDGQWHHAVGVWDGSRARLYVDGQLAAEQEPPSLGPLNPSPLPLMLGANNGLDVNFYAGLLDEVALFPFDLNLGYVRALYAAGSVPWAPVNVDHAAAPTSTWNYPLPSDLALDGMYQVNLRGTDMLGNRNQQHRDWNAWRGEVDLLAPRLVITKTVSGESAQVTCTATDFNLTLDGFECPCKVAPYDKTTYDQVSTWYREWFTDTNRLYRAAPGCVVEARAKPFTAKACDRYGRCSTAVTTVEDAQAPQAAPPSAVVAAPADRTVLADMSPLTLSVAGRAPAYLKAITVSLDGLAQQRFDFPAGVYTSVQTSTLWAPPAGLANGAHSLEVNAEDWAGQGMPAPLTSTLFVDTDMPTLAVASTMITTSRLVNTGVARVDGEALDQGGIRQVEYSTDGVNWQPAGVDSLGRWSGLVAISPVQPLKASLLNLQARASDLAGRQVEAAAAVTVDIIPPEPVTITLSYRNPQGQQTVLSPGTVLRDTLNPQLTLSWTPSQDDSGVMAYLVGLSESAAQDPNQLSAYGPDIFSHAQAAQEAHVYYAHVVVVDSYGNQSWTLFGPVYVDTPLTPDYAPLEIPPALGPGSQALQPARIQLGDGITLGEGVYRGWMDSGCTQIGVSRIISDTLSEFSTLSEVQRLYATWDEAALRLSWVGSTWTGTGSLFIYLNAGLGPGTTQAYNPNGSAQGVELPVPMNRAIWVEHNDTASLLQWDGSQWSQVAGGLLTGDQFKFTHWNGLDYTDLQIPFNRLGSSNLPGMSLDLLAFASDPDELRVWTAMPPANPLNSIIFGPSPLPDTGGQSLQLTNAYHWNDLMPWKCPNNYAADYDLRASLVATPEGTITQTRPGGLYWAYPLPVGMAPQPVGDGQTIVYRLVVNNAGEAAAPNVWAHLVVSGPLRLADGQDSLVIGRLPAGESREVNITAVIDRNLSPTEYPPPRLKIELYGSNVPGTAWEDNLVVEHQADFSPPVDLGLRLWRESSGGASLAQPGLTQLVSAAYDPAGVSQVELQVRSPQGVVRAQTCDNDQPGNGQWACVVDFSGAVSGEIFSVRSRATDTFGQRSEWSAWQDFEIDNRLPTVALDAGSEAALADHIVSGSEVVVHGWVVDDQGVSQVEVCLGTASLQYGFRQYLPLVAVPGSPKTPTGSRAAGQPGETADEWLTCETYDAASTGGEWYFQLPSPAGLDMAWQELVVYGVDAAGNRTAEPLRRTYYLDGAAPRLDITGWVSRVSLAEYQRAPFSVLTGSVSDGSGQAQAAVTMYGPGSELYHALLSTASGSWRLLPALSQAGIYRIYLQAYDPAGNTTLLEPFELEVVP